MIRFHSFPWRAGFRPGRGYPYLEVDVNKINKENWTPVITKHFSEVSFLGTEERESSWCDNLPTDLQTAIPTTGVIKILLTHRSHEKGNPITYSCRMLLEKILKGRVYLQAGALGPTLSQKECISWFSFCTVMVDYFNRSSRRITSNSNPH